MYDQKPAPVFNKLYLIRDELITASKPLHQIEAISFKRFDQLIVKTSHFLIDSEVPNV